MPKLQADTEFERELASLLNRFSLENGSNTPDFILAEYLRYCLDAFNYVSRNRENWFGGADVQRADAIQGFEDDELRAVAGLGAEWERARCLKVLDEYKANRPMKERGHLIVEELLILLRE